MPSRQARAQWARIESEKRVKALLAEARRERGCRTCEREGAVVSEERREERKLSEGKKKHREGRREYKGTTGAKAVTGRVWRGTGRRATAMRAC